MPLTKPPVKNPWADAGDKVEPTGAELSVGWPLSNIPPSRQRFNWIFNFLANGVRYLTRRGISDHDILETYEIGDKCRSTDGFTYSAKLQNINKLPQSNANEWELWAFTKTQLDNIINNGDYKSSVRFTTTANIVLTGLGTQAGGDWPAVLTAAERILVKNNTLPAENGIYTAAAGAWARATDADTGAELNSGSIIPVESGTLNADTNWQLTTDGVVTIGTTSLVFVDLRNVGSGYLMLRDEKATNTDGGSAVAGLQTRTLNTVSFNTITGASLSANQFTLPAGTYRINASAPAFGVNGNTAALRNVTDAVHTIVGTVENGTSNALSSADPVQTRSHIAGKFTITAAKVFDIRHDCTEAVATSGLGRATASTANLASVFTTVEIFREAV